MTSHRTLFGILFCLICISVNGQNGSQNALGKHINLSLNHTDGQYGKGERILVYAELNNQEFADLRMDFVVNGIKKDSYNIHLHSGKQCVLDTSFNDTRAVIVSLCSDKVEPHNLDIGFVVAPEGFRPGFRAPGDLKRYWKQQIALWRLSEPEVTLRPVEQDVKDASSFKCWSVEISCPEGRPVRGYLAMPSDAEPGSLPIVINSCAAGVSGSWCRATPQGALKLARYGNGCLGLMINAHGFPNDAPQDYYKQLEDGELLNYSTRHITTREDYYFRTMFLRMERALDYLCTRPEWDGKRVLACGESQGGAQAAALAGIDKRVTALVLNVPAMFDLGGSMVGRLSGWPKVCEREPENDAVSKVAPYFDAALLLHFSRAEIFCDIGLIDYTCPAASIYSGMNNSRGMVHVVTYPRRPHHEPGDKAIHEDFSKMIISKRIDFFNSYLK